MPETESEFYQWGYEQYDPLKDRLYLDVPREFYLMKYSLVRQSQQGYKDARRDFLFPHVISAMNALRCVAEEYNVGFPPGCKNCTEGWSIKIDGVSYEFEPGDFE